MDTATLLGGCLCGRVRYRVTAPAQSSSVCHCVSCRRASGAPAVAWFVVDERGFELTAGGLATYRSSPPVERGFCATCGTPLTYRHASSPGTIELTTASLDQPDAMPPAAEIWLSEKIGWAATDPALPQRPRGGEHAGDTDHPGPAG